MTDGIGGAGARSNRRLVDRLRRIEGQVRGLERMLDDNRDCGEILIQIQAVRGALARVAALVLERQARECMREGLDESEDAAQALIAQLLRKMGRYR